MKALNDYIILKEIKEKETKTQGGLLLAEKHREDLRYRRGEVFDSAPDILKCCDIIRYDRVAGYDMEIDGEIYKVIRLQNVIGKE